ncbi:m7GpppN-mRNA hydrolase-like isoform X1 [Penaeus chinensis]|uniref:m7GpppN-mRNA hydrolase-like isoform X1 n=2 Tax=Penaeus chinensis TaxID=139456 RepID=UPI001FB80398|nr:m7GpppN-mRNA hydrolase-like isoform X1 [Penaeus chinensis]
MNRSVMAPPAGGKHFVIPTSLLDDIISRFIYDAPESEVKKPISLCFLMEMAYWFYLDEYVEEDDSLNNIKFDLFAQQLLSRAGIKPESGSVEDMLQGFRDFKHRVPTYGGLLLNQDLSHVLLVQGFWHRVSWGFPKGKINVDEEPHCCAIREVLEETGYDISHLIDENVFLETSIGEQFVRLYIIPGVPMETEFVPRTKGEIKQLKWFPIHQLPVHKYDRNFNKLNGSTNTFYMVMPFVKPLREWLANRTRASNGNGNGREGRRRHRSSTTSTSDRQNYNQLHHSHSPAATQDALRKATPDTSKKQQNSAFSSLIQEEIEGYERLKADSSPRRKEMGAKPKTRKSLFDENQEETPKFTFRSRGKGRNKGGQTDSMGGEAVSKGFRSYSWQIFQINKKEVFEAVDRVWADVMLSW